MCVRVRVFVCGLFIIFFILHKGCHSRFDDISIRLFDNDNYPWSYVMKKKNK